MIRLNLIRLLGELPIRAYKGSFLKKRTSAEVLGSIMILLIFMIIPSTLYSQSYSFSYDASGNRISRQLIEVQKIPVYKTSASNGDMIKELEEGLKIVPSSESVLITSDDSDSEANLSVQLVDASGRIYYSSLNMTPPFSLDMQPYPSKPYLLVCSYKGKRYTWKIIKK